MGASVSADPTLYQYCAMLPLISVAVKQGSVSPLPFTLNKYSFRKQEILPQMSPKKIMDEHKAFSKECSSLLKNIYFFKIFLMLMSNKGII